MVFKSSSTALQHLASSIASSICNPICFSTSLLHVIFNCPNLVFQPLQNLTLFLTHHYHPSSKHVNTIAIHSLWLVSQQLLQTHKIHKFGNFFFQLTFHIAGNFPFSVFLTMAVSPSLRQVSLPYNIVNRR